VKFTRDGVLCQVYNPGETNRRAAEVRRQHEGLRSEATERWAAVEARTEEVEAPLLSEGQRATNKKWLIGYGLIVAFVFLLASPTAFVLLVGFAAVLILAIYVGKKR
jgi:hypothetical protein